MCLFHAERSRLIPDMISVDMEFAIKLMICLVRSHSSNPRACDHGRYCPYEVFPPTPLKSVKWRQLLLEVSIQVKAIGSRIILANRSVWEIKGSSLG